MILTPFSSPEEFKSALHPPEEKGEICWLIFSGNQLLVSLDKKCLPTKADSVLIRKLYLGALNDKYFFTGEVDAGVTAPSGWVWSPIRPLHGTLGEAEYALAGRAMQLLYWDRSNQYCGHCGQLTFLREHERCRECSFCGQLAYPKMSMAILALVKKEHQILLARSPHFSEPFFSALAGFVEPGETFEQCVMREVFEEVGLKVRNIQYFASQPWPLSLSLMIGFFCEWDKGEIQIDPHEIAEASWFDLSNLPRLPPVYSLARYMIDAMVNLSANQ